MIRILFLSPLLATIACVDSNEFLAEDLESADSDQLEKRYARDGSAYVHLNCSAGGLPTSFDAYLPSYTNPITFTLDGGAAMPASYIDLYKSGAYHYFTIDSDRDTVTTADDVLLLDFGVLGMTSNGDSASETWFMLDDIGC